MKKLEAIIDPLDLDEVKQHLSSIGVRGMTVSEVRGSGRRPGRTHRYRGVEHADWLPGVKIEIVVRDEQVAEVMDGIEKAATSLVGDRRVSVVSIDEVLHIRTAGRDVDAT